MNPTDFPPIRGTHSANIAILQAMAESQNEYFIQLQITDENAQNGTPGSVSSCAAALAAKEYFGRQCRPTVREEKDKDGNPVTVLSVSWPETHSRYRVILATIPNAPGAFDPEQYDYQRKQGIPATGGTIFMRSATVSETRHGQTHPRNYPRSESKPRKDRSWEGTTLSLKGETSASMKKTKKTSPQMVMPLLYGDVTPSVVAKTLVSNSADDS
jgi:hypothetical protein